MEQVVVSCRFRGEDQQGYDGNGELHALGADFFLWNGLLPPGGSAAPAQAPHATKRQQVHGGTGERHKHHRDADDVQVNPVGETQRSGRQG